MGVGWEVREGIRVGAGRCVRVRTGAHGWGGWIKGAGKRGVGQGAQAARALSLPRAALGRNE